MYARIDFLTQFPAAIPASRVRLVDGSTLEVELVIAMSPGKFLALGRDGFPRQYFQGEVASWE